MNGKVRRFRHKDGFSDDTDYIACNEDHTAWIVLRTGQVMLTFNHYLGRALEFVAEGSWVELEDWQ